MVNRPSELLLGFPSDLKFLGSTCALSKALPGNISQGTLILLTYQHKPGMYVLNYLFWIAAIFYYTFQVLWNILSNLYDILWYIWLKVKFNSVNDKSIYHKCLKGPKYQIFMPYIAVWGTNILLKVILTQIKCRDRNERNSNKASIPSEACLQVSYCIVFCIMIF